MIVAVVRCRIARGQTFAELPPGCLGIEVLRDGAGGDAACIVSRFRDHESFHAWYEGNGGELVHVGTREEGEEEASVEAALVRDASAAFARLLRAGAAIYAALVKEGRVVYANAALRKLAGRELEGEPLSVADTRGPVTLTIFDRDGAPHSLRCIVERHADGLLVLGEPPLDDMHALAFELQRSHEDLAVTTRELARLNRELQQAHWHVKKLSEVLPICVQCRKVRTEADWEDAASFLQRATSFLSHGYCEDCASEVLATLEEEP